MGAYVLGTVVWERMFGNWFPGTDFWERIRCNGHLVNYVCNLWFGADFW